MPFVLCFSVDYMTVTSIIGVKPLDFPYDFHGN